MTWLSLSHNGVSGESPSELGILEDSLVGLQLDSNGYFFGVVSPELFLLTNLVAFEIEGNSVSRSDIGSNVRLREADAYPYCKEVVCALWSGCGCLCGQLFRVEKT